MVNIRDCSLSCVPGMFEDSINPISGYIDDNEIQLTGCHDTQASSEKMAIERLIAEKNVLHFDPNDTSTYPLDADNKLNGTYTSKENKYSETYAAVPDTTNNSSRHDPPLIESLDNGTKYILFTGSKMIILNNFSMKTLIV